MTATLRRTVIVSVAALVVAVILVAAAATGPVGVVGDPQPGSTTTQTTQDPAQPPTTATERAEDEPPGESVDGDLGGWLHDLVAFALVLAGLWVSAAVLRLLAKRLIHKLPDKQLVLDLDPLPDVEAGRDAVRRNLESYEQALEGSEVRNGIVACWVLLEQSAAEVGTARRPAETATEFVIRFLHALDVDPRPVAALAGLYHEARFSTHELAPDARSRAHAALGAIRRDLGRTVTT